MSPDRRRPGPLQSPGRQDSVTTTVDHQPTARDWAEADIARLRTFAGCILRHRNGHLHELLVDLVTDPRFASMLFEIALRIEARLDDAA